MEKIYIIGASGFAKEVCNLLFTEKLFEVAGFIDYQPKEANLLYNGKEYPILNEEYFLGNEEFKGANVVIGVGSPNIIKKIFETYKDYNFPNIISKHAVVGNDVWFGKGNVITQNVIFTTNIKVGDGNIFNLATTVGHDTTINNYNVINPSVNVSGGIVIGDSNLLGVGCIILQYLTIGNDNVIGGASLVTKNVTDNKLIVGVPGKERM